MKSKERSWNLFLFLIPFNAALSGLTTYVPLGILSLKGSVIDVSTAAVAYSLVLIPAPLVWGYVCDTTGSRKSLIAASCLILFVISIGMYFTDTIIALILLYALTAQAAGMMTPAFNLLLLEALSKRQWDEGYTRSNLFTTMGQIFGISIGVPWVLLFSLRSYVLVCSSFSLLAVMLALIVRSPEITIEKRAILLTLQGFLHRLDRLPLIFVRLPRLYDFKSLWKMTRQSLTKETPVIFVSSALFLASGSLFFTSYTPFLKANSLGDSQVFFLSVYLVAVIALTSRILLQRFGGTVSHILASRALLVRAMGMLLTALFAVLVANYHVFYASILAFTLLGIGYALVNVNLNTLLFRVLPLGRQGGMLGVFSAFNGLALLSGSLASGYVSYFLGYSITFFLAATLVFLSSTVLELHYGIEIEHSR
jgi:MFS family permease